MSLDRCTAPVKFSRVGTAVKLKNGISKEFDVRMALHLGSMRSPLLFIIVMEASSSSSKQGLLWSFCMPMTWCWWLSLKRNYKC